MAAGWDHVEEARARLADERGTIFQEAPLGVALCYPSPYAVAMSSLGFQTIYREICRHPGAVAERVKFSTWLVFVAVWVTVVYAPLAHMEWISELRK